jgi:nucleotide-binding universal stress UspA family protein
MSAFRKILVPTDYSRHAREAFRVAYDLAKPTGASVVMFHISRPSAAASDGDRLLSGRAQAESQCLADEPQTIPIKVPAVRVEHEMIEADYPDAEQILRIRRERGCDVIVMGTRVRTGRKHRLFGSVTADVVRRAHCPVIVVTAPSGESGDSAHQHNRQPAVRVKS